MTAEPKSQWADRLELGEGARWVDGRLVLVDLLKGRLLAADTSASELVTLAELDVPLGAVAPIQGTSGAWIAAAGTGVCTLTSSGEVSWIGDTRSSGASSALRVNDAVADASGRFWFGTMAIDETEDAGALYRFDRDGTLTRVLDGITVPNGPAFTEDGTTMYLADSTRGLVRRYRVDPRTGELGEPEPFADFADLADLDCRHDHRPPSGAPDGMTVDRAGGVWIACWGGASVRRFRPDGTPDRVIAVPGARQPASVCLGGPDGRLLHITTATYGLDSPGALDGAVFTVPVEVPGFPAAAFRSEVRR
jgi:sugar lactone lactonase YvrE